MTKKLEKSMEYNNYEHTKDFSLYVMELRTF